MSLVHLNFESKYLCANTDVNVILPDRKPTQEPEDFFRSGKKYPVLWLLHGTFGDYTDWIRKSNVEVYASERDVIVVMPSAHNSDYVNWEEFGIGYRAYDYLLKELMPLIYGWFPANDRREDNYIGGLSMGGGGAMIYGYSHPEKFAGVYCMSFAPSRDPVATAEARSKASKFPTLVSTEMLRVQNQIRNAGGEAGYRASVHNIWDRTAELAGRTDLPELVYACGDQDPLMYQSYCVYKDYIRSLGIPAEFWEGVGYSHEWRFWELCIRDLMDRFFPVSAEG